MISNADEDCVTTDDKTSIIPEISDDLFFPVYKRRLQEFMKLMVSMKLYRILLLCYM